VLTAAPDLAKLDTVTTTLEVFSLKPGPDGLTRVTARRLGEGVRRSWVVPGERAEDAVLDEWAELHDAMLGYPPNW
jgi:hypothetical protein